MDKVADLIQTGKIIYIATQINSERKEMAVEQKLFPGSMPAPFKERALFIANNSPGQDGVTVSNQLCNIKLIAMIDFDHFSNRSV